MKGNDKYLLKSKTEDNSYSLDIQIEGALPFISFEDQYVKDTTVLESKEIVTPKVKLDSEYTYIASVKSPYSKRVGCIYYSNTTKVLFIIPSLDCYSNIADSPNTLSHKIIGFLLGVYGDAFAEDNNILLKQGIYDKNNIKYFDSAPKLNPTITTNNISADGLLSSTPNFRFKYDDLTLINAIPVNLIKLGSAKDFNSNTLPIYKNVYTGLKFYSAIKYIGDIKSTDDIYISLVF